MAIPVRLDVLYSVRIHYTGDQELLSQRTRAVRRDGIESRYKAGARCKASQTPDGIGCGIRSERYGRTLQQPASP